MTLSKNLTTINRRAVLTGAVAALPAIPACALPSVILPRTGLAAALQAHAEAAGETCAPFAARRGMPDWSFTVSNYRGFFAGDLSMMTDEGRNAEGWSINRRMETFSVRNGVLDLRIFQDKEEPFRRFNVDFPV